MIAVWQVDHGMVNRPKMISASESNLGKRMNGNDVVYLHGFGLLVGPQYDEPTWYTIITA